MGLADIQLSLDRSFSLPVTTGGGTALARMTGMNRRSAWKIMSALSGAYGITVALVGALHGPAGIVALVGALAIALGWTLSSCLTHGGSPGQERREPGA
jgi:hypothetical protein